MFYASCFRVLKYPLSAISKPLPVFSRLNVKLSTMSTDGIISTSEDFTRTASSNSQSDVERHQLVWFSELFIRNDVQAILYRLTGRNLDKIYRTKRHNLSNPDYKLMTDEELKQAMERADRKAVRKLQMPPYVPPRLPVHHVLSEDRRMDQHWHTKIVFTDISQGLKETERTVVVRDPNGTLRMANWDERERALHIYHPRNGRKVGPMPKMFETQHLQAVLERGQYEFVLDRACVQFDPDDQNYHRITEQVYQRVDKDVAFDSLHSTRHYGPMAYYLVRTKTADNLLISFIQANKLDEAGDLLRLYHILNPQCESALSFDEKDLIKSLKLYAEKDAVKKSFLHLAIKSYQDSEAHKEELEDTIRKSHGTA